jgi:hypothetical protein
MPAPRSTAKSAPAPSSKRPGREPPVPERESARARKRKALELFVDKNAKVLAELAK